MGLGDPFEELEVDLGKQQRATLLARHRQGPRADRACRVRDQAGFAGRLGATQPVAIGAGPVGRVEREQPRLERRGVGAAARAGALGRVAAVARLALQDDVARAQLDGLFDGFPQARELLGVGLQAVDDDLDRVALVARQLGHVFGAQHLAVDAHAHETLLGDLFDGGPVVTLAVADARSEDQHAPPGLLAQDLLHDALGRLRAQRELARGAVSAAGAREQHAQVVDDLRQRADGRARPAAGRALIDGDGRGESLDGLDVGLLHAAEELPRVGRECLEEAPLPLPKQRIEGQGGLAGARDPGHGRQPLAGDVDVQAAQVVLARATDPQGPRRHRPSLA